MNDRMAPLQSELPAVRGSGSTLIRVMQGATTADMVNGVEGAPRMMTNLPIQSVAGKRMMLRATGTADYDVDALNGKPVYVKYFMVEVATVNDENSGSLVQVPRTTFFDAEGKFVAFTSWAIARYLDKFILSFGEGPYDPPIGLTFRRVAAGKGQQSYNVDLVE